ncbi:energy transducer TonB [Sphingorhabdus sp.]|uniref:energy transducer TonB n=1 Tax=Sphingorhabdus sp. TaxID=1902408 RepID=UPI0032B788E1
MFGFGKPKCKECGATLSDFEDVRDRVDDLMRSSAHAAEPLENVCAKCRVTLAKGKASLRANLHVIEARRVESELQRTGAVTYAETTPSLEAVEPTAPVEIIDPYTSTEYVPGDGYKTLEEERAAKDDEYKQFRLNFPQSGTGAVLDWLVNTKIGRNMLGVGVILLVLLFNALDSDDQTMPPASREIPYESVEQPALQYEIEPLPAEIETSTQTISSAIAVPLGNPGTWVTTNDYPSRALQQKRQGTTAFRLEVGAGGKPTACTVTKSSGHSDLDAATCKALMRRARFGGESDASGPASWSSRVRWQIPE